MELAALSLPIHADLTGLARDLANAPKIAASALKEAVKQAGQAAVQEAKNAGALQVAAERSSATLGVAAVRAASAEKVALIKKESNEAAAAARVMAARIAAESHKGAQGAVNAFKSIGVGVKNAFSFGVFAGMGAQLAQTLTRDLVGGLKAAISIAADFEQSMNVLKASTGATDEMMAKAAKTARTLGADLALPNTSSKDAAEVILALTQAGLSMNDAMAASKGVIQLSAAAHLSNAEAAQINANVLNTWKMSGKESINVSDMLTNAWLSSGKSVHSFSEAVQSGGAVAAQAGVSAKEFLTVMQQMARAGIQGSDAGTSFKTAMLRLMAPTNETTRTLREFNVQVRDAHGNMLPMDKIIEQFSTKLKVGAPFVTAYGGSIGAMDKALKKAEEAAKSAEKVLATMPNTLRLQSLHLDKLKRDLADVNKPEMDLTETIRHQQTELDNLTSAMKRNTEEGLKKLGRESEDAKGRIAETTIELELQREKLAQLQREMASGPAPMKQNAYGGFDIDTTAVKEKQLEIVRLQNTIRDSENNLGDWKSQIADADRQMKEGLDSDKEKAERIKSLTHDLDENKQKLKEWQQGGREAATLELKAQIDQLGDSMAQNRQKMAEAHQAMTALDVARQNATRVVKALTAAERDKALQTIFGTDGIRFASIVLAGGTEANKKAAAAIGQTGTAAKITEAQTKGLNGALKGLKSTLETIMEAQGSKVLAPLTKGLNDFSKALQDISTGKFSQFTSSANATFGGILAFAKPRIDLLIQTIKLVSAAVRENWPQIKTIAEQAFGGTNAAFQKVADFIRVNGPQIRQVLSTAFQAIATVANAVFREVLAAAKPVIAWFKENWPLIKQTVMTVLNTIRELWKAHGAEIMAFLKPLWETIKAIVGTAMKVIGDSVRLVLQLMNGDFKGAGATALKLWNDLWAGLGRITTGGVKLVGAGLGLLFSSLLDLGKRMVTATVHMGEQLVHGLINGIKGAIPALGNALQGVANSVIATMKTALRIQSPSQEMYAIGAQTGQGFALGIGSTLGAVAEAAGAVAAAAMGAMNQVNSPFQTRTSQSAKDTWESFNASQRAMQDYAAAGGGTHHFTTGSTELDDKRRMGLLNSGAVFNPPPPRVERGGGGGNNYAAAAGGGSHGGAGVSHMGGAQVHMPIASVTVNTAKDLESTLAALGRGARFMANNH